MKKNNLFLTGCLWATVMFLMAGCNKKTGTPGSNNSNANVADPTGTVTVSARNWSNGDTWVSVQGNYFHIDAGDNFEGKTGAWQFASAGQVHGLGNITKIPTSGWAPTSAVLPGYGYVGYCGNTFVRIYVDSYITEAGTNGIIGALIKYQQPFNGDAKAIGLPKSITMTDLSSDNGGTHYYYYTASIPMNIVSGVTVKFPTTFYSGQVSFNTSTGQASLAVRYGNTPTAPPASATLTVSAPGFPDEQITVVTP